MEAPLQAPLSVKFDYTRSLGPVLSAFFTGIREGYFVGARTSAGVMVPPPEFDPTTLEPITEFVELPGSGVVQSWSWVSEPVAGPALFPPVCFRPDHPRWRRHPTPARSRCRLPRPDAHRDAR
ncbi:MAG: hypothetical protein V9E81_00670 [Marmoricola sp.]